jgi:hypothetical protein
MVEAGIRDGVVDMVGTVEVTVAAVDHMDGEEDMAVIDT